MIEMACHAAVHCCAGLAGEVVSSIMESLGGPALSSDDPAAEARRLTEESAAEQSAFDDYMLSRDTKDDMTSNEWVLRVDPLTQNPVALALMARLQDGNRK
jgi:hypothetical protein